MARELTITVEQFQEVEAREHKEARCELEKAKTEEKDKSEYAKDIERVIIFNGNKVFKRFYEIWKNGSDGFYDSQLMNDINDIEDRTSDLAHLAEDYHEETGQVHPDFVKFSNYANMLFGILNQERNVRKNGGYWKD